MSFGIKLWKKNVFENFVSVWVHHSTAVWVPPLDLYLQIYLWVSLNLSGYRNNLVRRYVDDIFSVLKSQDQLQTCLDSLNSKHPIIKFTVEKENNGSISFLDILVSRTIDSTVDTTTYCKPTNTGLLTNYTSFTDYNYKTGLIKTLADRTTKINSTAQLLKQDPQRVSKTLQRILFPNYSQWQQDTYRQNWDWNWNQDTIQRDKVLQTTIHRLLFSSCQMQD